jgi:hypothetical protein
VADAPDSGDNPGWLIHDVVVGALAGGAAGMVIGLFALARVDNRWLAGIAVVAIISTVFGLLRWERNRRRGAGPITVLTWVVMVLSIGFIALIVSALRNFT